MRQGYSDQGKRLLESLHSTFDETCKLKIKQEAISSMQKGITITKEIEKNCIAALKLLNITVIVSPNEIATQLLHLCNIGMCQAILTEDYDILTYSGIISCPHPILMKFEQSGNVCAINVEEVFKGTKSCSTSVKQPLNSLITESISKDCSQILKQHFFRHQQYHHRLFLLCSLTGNDYCEGVQHLSVAEAIKACLLITESEFTLQSVLTIVNYLRDAHFSLNSQFSEKLMASISRYSNQFVYNPITKSLERFTSCNTGISSHLEAVCQKKGICVSTVCEGEVCIHDFTKIKPQFPWDKRPECLQPPNAIAMRSVVWGTRRTIQKTLSQATSNVPTIAPINKSDLIKSE